MAQQQPESAKTTTPAAVKPAGPGVAKAAIPKAQTKHKAPRKRRKNKPGKAVATVTPSKAITKYEPPKNTLDMIAQAARDPRVDVAKLQALLNMRREIEKQAAEDQFTAALSKAQEEMPVIVKDKATDKSKYASLETIKKLCDPVIQRNGFTLSYGTATSDLTNHYRVTCQVRHIAGHSRDYFIDVPADDEGDKGNKNKSGIKAVGSTMSYARRYLRVMIFDISIVGEDKDGASDKDESAISEAQVKFLRERCDKEGVDIIEFCKWAKIDALADLPASLYQGALNGLDKRLAQKQAKKK